MVHEETSKIIKRIIRNEIGGLSCTFVIIARFEGTFLPQLNFELSARSESASSDETGLDTCWSVTPTEPRLMLVIISVSSCST